MRSRIVCRAALVLTCSLVFPLGAQADVEEFDGLDAGTVVAGTLPQGGTASGMDFAGFTLSVSNNDGPSTCAIFDSSNPTGEDEDLGTPNETCTPPGPGEGSGGEVGTEGENCGSLGNLLIIAEDIEDTNEDNIIDDPDDEADGGSITFMFDDLVVVDRLVIMDIDSETAEVVLEATKVTVTVSASDLGNNSRQTLDLASVGPVIEMEVIFSSSGAIGEIEFNEPAVPVEETSWGRIKANFPN